VDSNYSERLRRLGAIRNRLTVADVADASISSSSLDAVDSSVPTVPIAIDSSAHIVKSNSLTTTASNQDSLLIDLLPCAVLPEDNKCDSLGSDIEQNSLIDIQQTDHSRPVPPPRKSKQVPDSDSSHLTQVAAAVTSDQKPVSDSLTSTAPLQSVQEARALFIQSTTPPIVKVNPRQTNLDQFDPLASGQLVVDGPSSKTTSTAESTEENLLKEWNLNFSQMTSNPRFVRPGVPVQPQVMGPPSTVYASMPNLGPGGMRIPYPAYGVRYPPSQPVQPWAMNLGVRPQSSGPAAAMSTRNGAVDGTDKRATLPSGFATVPAQIQPSLEVGGSAADVTGSAVSNVALDWTANIDVLMRPHSMDLSSLSSVLSNPRQSSLGQTWEKFD